MISNFQIWIFMFAGTGNNNYTGYLLDLFCKIVYEYPEKNMDSPIQQLASEHYWKTWGVLRAQSHAGAPQFLVRGIGTTQGQGL